MRKASRSARSWLAGLSLAAGVLLGVACEGRPRQTGADDEAVASAAEDHVAELDLRRGVPEKPSVSILGRAPSSSFADLVARLRSMPEEAKMKGLLIRLESAIALARAEEIGRHVKALRDKGLPVVCHAHGYSNSTMLLASQACDEIFLSPAGTVDTVGIAGQLVFGRALLDRLHVEVDFLQVGKFKGAKEPFTNTSSSPEARESLQNALSGLRGAWIDGVTQGRKAPVRELEGGPHTPEAAKTLGLIDEIGFYREARDRVLERAGAEGRVTYFGGGANKDDGFAELLRAISGAGGSGVPHIAVVRATGGITMQGGGSIFGGDGGISYQELAPLLARLERNSTVKAVVLRIDSPGGSALASDLLWRALMDLREDKPLVVSIGSMAASGGYYLACAANKILAERTSIVGSIGVVAGKLSFDKSLREIGVNIEAVPAKEGADPTRALLASPLVGWDDATREKLEETIQHMYDLFIARIAEGRGVERARFEASTEGRIMGGDDAKAGGLVDQIGGLSDAIDVAIELAGVDASIPIDIVEESHGLLDFLGVQGAKAQAVALHDLEQRTAERIRSVLTGGLLPYRDEVAAFAESTSPLLAGERLLVALPYVFAIR